MVCDATLKTVRNPLIVMGKCCTELSFTCSIFLFLVIAELPEKEVTKRGSLHIETSNLTLFLYILF